MSKRGPVYIAGSAVLSAVARPIAQHEKAGLAPLVARMKRIFLDNKARGLAAPQVGESLRLFMVARGENNDFAPLVALNPSVVRRSQSYSLEWERCLSVPDHAALVSRARKVDVQYQTLSSETPVRTVLKGCARGSTLAARLLACARHSCPCSKQHHVVFASWRLFSLSLFFLLRAHAQGDGAGVPARARPSRRRFVHVEDDPREFLPHYPSRRPRGTG
jgi:peptide deformylase